MSKEFKMISLPLDLMERVVKQLSKSSLSPSQQNTALELVGAISSSFAAAPQPPALGGEPELGLSFQKLRQANVKRLASSKYKLCEQNWQPAHWMNALTGEVGECANIIKKVDRGDYSLESALPNIARELADIQCYLDILAFKLGIDLGAATVSKFDEVSERIGSPIRLGEPAQEIEVCKVCKGKGELFYHMLEDGWYEPCKACQPAGSEQV